MGLRPHVRQQVGQVGPGGADGQFGQDMPRIRPRFQVMLTGAGADAQQDGGSLQPAIASDVQPVPAADGQRPDGPFGGPLSMANRASVKYRNNDGH